MKHAVAALFAITAVTVCQPAMAVNSSFAQMQATINAAGPMQVKPPTPTSCEGALEMYFSTTTGNDMLHEVMEACFKVSERLGEGHKIEVAVPKKISELPSKSAVEQAVRAVEQSANKLAEEASKDIPDLDLIGKLDFLACHLELPGAKCENGHFLPASGWIRSAVKCGLQLFGKDQNIEKAYSLFRGVQAGRVKVLLSTVQMVKSLAVTYPTTERELKDWVKGYRFVMANVEIVTKILDSPLMNLKQPDMAAGSFSTTV